MVLPNIRQTAELVQEISSGSREQSQGVDQVNSALGQLDAIIQQNAAAAEELAAMSKHLEQQARGLSSSVDFFSVDEHESESESAWSMAKRDEAGTANRSGASRASDPAGGSARSERGIRNDSAATLDAAAEVAATRRKAEDPDDVLVLPIGHGVGMDEREFEEF